MLTDPSLPVCVSYATFSPFIARPPYRTINLVESRIFDRKNDYFVRKKNRYRKISSLKKQLNYHFEALSIDTVDFPKPSDARKLPSGSLKANLKKRDWPEEYKLGRVSSEL